MFPQSFEEEVLRRLDTIEKLLKEKPLTSDNDKAVKQETDPRFTVRLECATIVWL